MLLATIVGERGKLRGGVGTKCGLFLIDGQKPTAFLVKSRYTTWNRITTRVAVAGFVGEDREKLEAKHPQSLGIAKDSTKWL